VVSWCIRLIVLFSVQLILQGAYDVGIMGTILVGLPAVVWDICAYAEAGSKKGPPVNVCLEYDINDDVDGAIHILDSIYSSGSMAYAEYCELHEAICDIYIPITGRPWESE